MGVKGDFKNPTFKRTLRKEPSYIRFLDEYFNNTVVVMLAMLQSILFSRGCEAVSEDAVLLDE